MSGLDLNKIPYFLAVAEHLSFQKASQVLNVAQPAISRAVQQLEIQLGFELFTRTTRIVTLTEAGAVFARDSRQMVEKIKASARFSKQISDGNALNIILGYSFSLSGSIVSDQVFNLRQRFPLATIDVMKSNSKIQVDALVRGEIDGGFLLADSSRPPLVCKVLCKDRLVVLTHPENWVAHRSSVFLAELKDEKFVMGGDNWSPLRNVINKLCEESGFAPNVVTEENDFLLMTKLLFEGRGITLLNRSSVESAPSKLVTVPIADEQAIVELGFAWNPLRNLPIIADLFATL